MLLNETQPRRGGIIRAFMSPLRGLCHIMPRARVQAMPKNRGRAVLMLINQMRSVDNFLIALIHLYQLGSANDVLTANGNCWQIFLFSTNLVFLTRNDRWMLDVG